MCIMHTIPAFVHMQDDSSYSYKTTMLAVMWVHIRVFLGMHIFMHI